MLQSDLQSLLEARPDRSLATLEGDTWKALARHTRTRRVFRAVFAVQAAVMAAALMGSAVVGFHSAPENRGAVLDIFSPRATLAASTLLADHEP